MAEASYLQDFVDGADVDSAVFTLRPDYRVLLLAVDGLAPGASDVSSEALLRRAEEAAVALLTGVAAEHAYLASFARWAQDEGRNTAAVSSRMLALTDELIAECPGVMRGAPPPRAEGAGEEM